MVKLRLLDEIRSRASLARWVKLPVAHI